MAAKQIPQASESTTDGGATTYIIQRSSETVRDWWTGHGWSDDLNQAKQYDDEPDACVETADEMAVAIKRTQSDD